MKTIKCIANCCSVIVVSLVLASCVMIAPEFNLVHALESVDGNQTITIQTIAGVPNGFPLLVKLHGSSYDFGLVWGRIAQKAGVPLLTRTEQNQALQIEIENLYRDIDPGYLEFVAGIAAAYGQDVNTVDLIWLEHDFFMDYRILQLDQSRVAKSLVLENPRWACTIVSVWNGSEMFVGRNADELPAMYPYGRFVVNSALDGEYHFIGNALLSPVNLVIDGQNEQGLFVGNMAVSYPYQYDQIGARPYPNHAAVDPNHFMRILLGRCATVAEAIVVSKKCPQWFSNGMHHILVADKTGASAVLEWDTAGNLHVIQSDRNWQVCANTAVGLDEVTARFDPKYAQTWDRLQISVPQDITGLEKLMRAVIVPYELHSQASTAWMSLYQLNTGRMQVFSDRDQHVQGFMVNLLQQEIPND